MSTALRGVRMERPWRTGSDDRTVKLWDAATGKLLANLPGHTDSICSVAWSPDGKTLASSSGDTTLKLWDAATGKLLVSMQGHTGRCPQHCLESGWKDPGLGLY